MNLPKDSLIDNASSQENATSQESSAQTKDELNKSLNDAQSNLEELAVFISSDSRGAVEEIEELVAQFDDEYRGELLSALADFETASNKLNHDVENMRSQLGKLSQDSYNQDTEETS